MTFTNDATSNTLTFTTEPPGDASLLLDATGFVLQETSALPGGWTDSTATVTVQVSQNMVNVTPTATKFYRLKQ